jgi:hypothetical protein
MASHTMTPARRAALRKAQLASAAKRRGRRRKAIIASAAAGGFAFHHATGAGITRSPLVTAAAFGAGAALATRDYNPKRRRMAYNARVDRKLIKSKAKTRKAVTKQANIVQSNTYQNAAGEMFINARGAKAYNRGVRAHNRGVIREQKLRSRMK